MSAESPNQDPVIFRDSGSGPVIVLIHGMSAKIEHWLGFDQLLAQNFRVITFDHRGFGEARRPGTWSMSIEQMAGDVIEILDRLQIEKAHLFGISMGGMVAMACGIHHPHRCASLTIVNSSLGSQLNRLSRQRVAQLTGTLRKLMEPSYKVGLWERRVGLFLGHNPPQGFRSELSKTLLQLNQDQKNSLANRLKQYLAISRFRCEHRLKDISVPTLIIKSTHDHIVPSSHSDYLARMIPGAQLAVIEKAGHVPMFDRAEELRDIVVGWLNKQPRPAQTMPLRKS